MHITRCCFLASLALLHQGCASEPEPEASRAAPALGSLQLAQGATLCLMGGALAERMQHHGWLETSLQERFREHALRVRNLGFSADEVDIHQRTANFGKFSADGIESNLAQELYVPWDRYLQHTGADVILAFFGYNESFAGEAGLPAFERKLKAFIEHMAQQDFAAGSAPELVLFGSIPQEDLGDPNLPDGSERNASIQLYNAAMARVAASQATRFVDLFDAMQASYAAAPEPLSINGIHLNEAGNRVLAELISTALFGAEAHEPLPAPARQALREAVLQKNLLWFNRYRATDGYNVYGDRSRLTYVGAADGKSYSNFEVLQREMDHLDGLVAAHDETLWQLANQRPAVLDLSAVLPLLEVETNKPGEGSAGAHLYRAASEVLGEIRAAPGMRVQLFADERQFPELVNPVQMAWDTRGRLWVATWQTYPHWKPDQEMNDKLLILEDTDGDGRANTCTVFADDLHNPTGFEFWNGGVLLASQPDLLWLRDLDGDDRVDHSERLLHGLSSADTHHGANSFVIGPDGALYFQEGTFHQSQVESIYGPIRQRGACAWRFDPRTWRVERYIPYGFANPHGHVFDAWGQDFITDGTGNANYYALGFSGHLPQPQNHSSYFTFFNQRTRPAGGTEILSSRHFPEAQQGNYLIANVIGFRGIHQYEIEDHVAGFGARELDPIVESNNQNFRPVDIEVGPDGAIYFLDWHNAIIGHMQHHLRDPSRDAAHGRVYRVTHAGRELLQPVPIFGRPIEELLEALKSPEDRTRYRVRLELSGRDSDAVLAAAARWLTSLDAKDPGFEHHRLEALWLHQQHNRVPRELLLELLRSADARARAAATRVLRHSRHLIPDALELLMPQIRDEHPRVRLEALVAASFFGGSAAASLALEVLKQPTDKYLDYALKETMRALESDWKSALRAGEPLAAGNLAGIEYLLQRVDAADLQSLPHIPAVLMAMLTRHGVAPQTRRMAAAELAAQRGATSSAVLLEAMDLVDASSSSHAEHVLYQLSDLLSEWSALDQGPTRERLLQQAEAGLHLGMRAIGYAALINKESSVDAALFSALQSGPRLQALFEGVQRIEDPELRLGLLDTLRSFMFEVPSLLGRSGPGTGLEVGFYEPRPPSATREAFAALSPSELGVASHFHLDLPPARASDSFGLAFSGSLFVPSTGLYRFSTTSDDGTRLFIDGQEVVDNDGDHAAVSKSGELELSAGAHRIRLHYYEAGGGEALEVRWSGPDLVDQEIPAAALGSGLATRLRHGATRAMAHLPGLDAEKFRLGTRLLGQAGDLDATLDLLTSANPKGQPGTLLGPVFEALLAYLGALPPAQRTTAPVQRAIHLGHKLAFFLDAANGAALSAELDALGGLSIVIRTLPHQMRYDITEFEVQAGMPVSIIFQNNDMMPHNLVISLPGSLAEVGQAAEKLSGQGASTQFIPETDSVLWHTGLLLPGQSERLSFVAPEQVGDHPYVCTYPGHWRVMNGNMRVVQPGTALADVERREDSHAEAEIRPFVKDWSLAELQPLLEQGWEAGASVERGAALFDAAGCSKCHSVEGRGSLAGPVLSAIREKYRPAAMLEHILEPSKEVLEEYAFYVFGVQGSADVVGRILEDDGTSLRVMPSLLEPEEVISLQKAKITSRYDTKLSAMPTGLLVTLNAGEILDLLKFLQSPKNQ